MPVSWITHKGKQILYADYSACRSTEEMLLVLKDLDKEFTKLTGKVLTLSNFEGQYGSNEFMAEAKRVGKAMSDKRERAAVIGIVGLKTVLLSAYNRFVKDKLVPFKEKEEALDYLVS